MNDKRYADYEFSDETSQFDPLGRWMPGGEYYQRDYRCRVPRRMLEAAEKSGDFSKVDDWIATHTENEIWF